MAYVKSTSTQTPVLKAMRRKDKILSGVMIGTFVLFVYAGVGLALVQRVI
jgi:hypothetical protein